MITPFRESRQDIRLGDSGDRMPKMPARIDKRINKPFKADDRR